MEQYYYRRLEVYQHSKNLAMVVNDLIKSFPIEERYALSSQLRRASTSVMFNIAEGFGRYSINDRLRFLEIANGSLMETSSELELAEAYGYISYEELNQFDQQILSIVKQLAGLRESLMANNK
jgi:four helix bundle protein